jgi:phospholipase/carboxylesterase
MGEEAIAAAGRSGPLPTREGAPPPVHHGMPHAQIGVTPVPEVNRELFRRAFSLPGVSNRPTIVSTPGARGLWLDESIPTRERIMAGREFAHIHPDGSMHLTLPAGRAAEAIEAGWAEPHPIATVIGEPGLVLIYTPRDFGELEVIWQLVTDAYERITGERPSTNATAFA